MNLYKLTEFKYINLDHITIIRSDTNYHNNISFTVNFVGQDYIKINEFQFNNLIKHLNKTEEELGLPNYPI